MVNEVDRRLRWASRCYGQARDRLARLSEETWHLAELAAGERRRQIAVQVAHWAGAIDRLWPELARARALLDNRMEIVRQLVYFVLEDRRALVCAATGAVTAVATAGCGGSPNNGGPASEGGGLGAAALWGSLAAACVVASRGMRRWRHLFVLFLALFLVGILGHEGEGRGRPTSW